MSATTTSETQLGTGTQADPFILKKGKNFGILTTVKNTNGSGFDLTNYTGRAQMRRLATDTGPPVATFTVTNRNQTTERGKADITLPPTTSQTGGNGVDPDIAPGEYVADVEFEETAGPDPDDVVGSAVFHVRVLAEVTK